MDVKTKVGREFLKIIDSSFPVGNPLHGKLTRHNMKLAYSTSTNMRSQLSKHNARLLNADQVDQVRPCSCTWFECPLNGLCESDNVVYQATISSKNPIIFPFFTKFDFYLTWQWPWHWKQKKNRSKLKGNSKVSPLTTCVIYHIIMEETVFYAFEKNICFKKL